MAFTSSQPLEIQTRSVYCTVYPRGYPPTDNADQQDHALVVEQDGVRLTTILLFGPPPPSVEDIRSRLIDEGDLTEMNALEVTERFGMPDTGPVENKLYQLAS